MVEYSDTVEDKSRINVLDPNGTSLGLIDFAMISII